MFVTCTDRQYPPSQVESFNIVTVRSWAVGGSVGVTDGLTLGVGVMAPTMRVVAMTATGAAPVTHSPVSVKEELAAAAAQLGGVTKT